MIDLPSALSALIHPRPGEDEPQLQQVASNLLGLLEQENLGFWCWPLAHKRIYLSNTARQLLGLLGPAPSAAQTYLELVHPDDQASVEQALSRLINGLPLETALHHRVQHSDGQMHWLQLSGQRQSLANGELQLTGLLRESRTAQAEAALRASENKFAASFRSTPDSMIITQRDTGTLLQVNPAFERQFGWSSAQAIGHTSLEMGLWCNPLDRQTMLTVLADNGHFEDLEVELTHHDGNHSTNLLYGAECLIDGQVCLALTLRDISHQRQQEQALRDSQERLQLALESAELGLWDWHLPSNQLFASARAASLHGLANDTYNGPLESFFTHIPLEDQRTAVASFKQLRDGHQSNTRTTYCARHADGSQHFLEGSAKLYRNAQGQPERMVGVLRDITARTLREQALVASEEKFASLFQGTPSHA